MKDTMNDTPSGPSTFGEPGSAYNTDGSPSVAQDAGYLGLEPKQFADETNRQFQNRVDMFESARASAGGLRSKESADRAKARLKEEYDAAIAKIDAETVTK